VLPQSCPNTASILPLLGKVRQLEFKSKGTGDGAYLSRPNNYHLFLIENKLTDLLNVG
jgi:hypothetical protein